MFVFFTTMKNNNITKKCCLWRLCKAIKSTPDYTVEGNNQDMKIYKKYDCNYVNTIY